MLKNVLKITVRAKIFTIAKRSFRAKFKVLQSIGKSDQVEPGVGATELYPAFLIDDLDVYRSVHTLSGVGGTHEPPPGETVGRKRKEFTRAGTGGHTMVPV